MDNNFRVPIHSYRPSKNGEPESTFKTPEEVATEVADKKKQGLELPPMKKDKTKRRHKLLAWFNNLSKRRKIIVVGASVIVLAAIVTGLVFGLSSKPSKTIAKQPTIVKKVPPKPTTVASKLTGLQISPGINQGSVTGVMIENSDAARPQSGLIDAGVVFEAIAEGGVTRFLALYLDTAPASIGPIRSVRPYYIAWDMGFDAPIAHVGGSPDALSDIGSFGTKNLDEFANGSYYTRISSRDAPHNVYTSMAELNSLEASKGYTTSNFTSFPRKKDSPSAKPNATSIDFTLSGPDYNAHYDYNKANNSYNRSEGGAPHTDLVSGAQISPKVVVAIVVPETNGALDATGAFYSDYSYLGSGTADVFEDGTVVTGTWQKTSNTTQITFTDSAGNPIKLNAGQTWVTAVSTLGSISYQ